MDSAQDQQDAELAKRKPVPPNGIKDLVTSGSGGAASETSSHGYDPIENAMRRHPGLTREEAEAMAEKFGF